MRVYDCPELSEVKLRRIKSITNELIRDRSTGEWRLLYVGKWFNEFDYDTSWTFSNWSHANRYIIKQVLKESY